MTARCAWLKSPILPRNPVRVSYTLWAIGLQDGFAGVQPSKRCWAVGSKSCLLNTLRVHSECPQRVIYLVSLFIWCSIC